MGSRTVVWSMVLVAGCGFRVGPGNGAPADAEDDAPADVSIDQPSPDGPRTDWWDTAWRKRVKVTIDTTKLTGNALDDFPILVALPSTVDPGTGGAALRFVSSDNLTTYVHEIDTTVPGGTTWAWVKVPMLQPGSMKPTLWAYYDNPTALTTSNGPALWNARHTSVHHLGASLDDSTGSGHTGTASGNPTSVAGQLALATSFDGNDAIELANEGPYDYTTQMYVSIWVKVATFDTAYQAIVTKGDSSWRLARGDQSNGAGFGTTSGTTNDNQNGSVNISDNKWHMVAGVMDGTTKLLYIDGAVDETTSYNVQLDNNQFTVRLGMNPESNVGGPRYWKGELDELRVSAGNRSAAWIRAEYVNGKDPNFVNVGAPEPY